jgi:hypothetical protein
LSGPSTMLSGLSDPMSSLTAGEPGQQRRSAAPGQHFHSAQQREREQSRMHQLAAIRQQWASQQQQQQQRASREQSNTTNDSLPISDFGMKGSGSSGLASLQRSLSFPDVLTNMQTGSIREDMSWTDMNSLAGGGIGGSLLSGASFGLGGSNMGPVRTPGNSLLSGASSEMNPIPLVPLREGLTGEQRVASGFNPTAGNYLNPIPLVREASGSGSQKNSGSSGSRSTNRMGTNVPPRERGMSNMSTSIASMSINSGADSLQGSIMSDLSESLIALDLAEPRLLDQM